MSGSVSVSGGAAGTAQNQDGVVAGVTTSTTPMGVSVGEGVREGGLPRRG